MIGINFDKSTAERFLECIERGQPIECPNAAGWTCDAMLALAGALHFSVLSHGPQLYRNWDWIQVPQEHKEALDEQLFGDLAGAIEYYSHLTMLVNDEEYDAQFEDQHRAGLSVADGQTTVHPFDGTK